MKRSVFTLIFFTLFVGTNLLGAPKCKIIAHRGYWKSEGSVRNSLSALKAATDAGFYGSEFDVWVTKDGVPVVNHDATFDGVNIEKSPYEDVKGLKLANGEKMPSLEEYLQQGVKQRKTKLILELKAHSTRERNIEAARVVTDMVKKCNAVALVEYITFNMDAGLELIRLNPRSQVAYLNGDVSPAELKTKGYTGLDYHINVMRKNPNWFAEAKKSKLTVNVWTVNDEKTIREMIEQGADFITSDEPMRVKAILSE